MTKQIHIQLSESQANTLLKVIETHPNPGAWGNVSRNEVTAEIRKALSSGVRGEESSVDDRIVGMQFDNPNQVRQDQGLDPIVQTPVEDETPEGDEAADGQVEAETPAEPEADVETEKTEDELLAEMLAEEESSPNEDAESDGTESDEVAHDGDVDNSDR